MQYPSLYRAKAVAVAGGRVRAFIPQVYGNVEVTITAYMGGLPTEPGMGWVFFQAGNPEFPVWAGVGAAPAGGGGGEGADEVWIGPSAPSDPAIELWFDPDAPSPVVTGATSYVHNQGTPAAVWLITHNLGYYPAVHVEDSAGNDVEGDVEHLSVNQLKDTFSAAFSGIAYLS